MKKILIVDDEPMMLKIADRALKNNYETILASSGKEALELFVSNSPDLVISDLKMPEMSGIELQEQLREKGAGNVPFIFMTADESDDSESILIQKGAADLIRKPVKADVLIERVGIVLERAVWGDISKVPNENEDDDISQDPEVAAFKAERAKLPEWIIHAPLIDIHKGLKNSETADGYMSALNVFFDHADENVKALDAYFASEDIENYTIKVHALKSTSRIIGAMILSAMAAALERAGNEKDLQYISDEHASFISEYRKYLKLLSANMKKEAKKSMSSEEMNDAILALKEYVNAEDFTLVHGAIEYFQNYELPPEKDRLISDIKTCLNKLDWDAIHGIMDI